MPGAVRAARRSPGRNLLPVSVTVAGALLLVIGFVAGAGASTPDSEVAVLAPSADTFIAEAAPSSAHNTGLLSVTGNDSAATEWSGLQFDLAGYFDTASYPQDVDVVSAQLTLTVETAPANLLTLTPRRLAAASTWSETATWTNSQAKWNSGSDGANYPIDNTTTSVTIDVTADVQGFLDGDYTNNGWAIRAQTGAETVVFHSSEAADENDRPRLTIEYDTRTSLLRPPAGLYATDIAGTFEDTYVQPGAPGAANGTLDYIRIGRSSTDRMDTLIRFDFGADNPPIDQATILSARLVLPVKVPGVDRTLHAARICRPAGLSLDGAISAATYNSVPYSALQSVQASPPLDYTNGMAELTFDVTGIVQAWADGEANLGFHVYQQSPIPAVADWIDLYSFNESLNTNRPRLEFEYVPDGGNSNPTATPSCEEATPTPTNTNTPTHTPTGTPGTPTATPTGTQTDTPTPPATNTPTNTPTGTPGITTSAELTLDSPDEDAMVPRSRLTFTATSGSLAPAVVSFVIQRDADDMYWDAEAAAWTADEFENAATGSGSEWSYAVTGDARRLFVDTELTVEIRASKGSQEYRSAESASVTVR